MRRWSSCKALAMARRNASFKEGWKEQFEERISLLGLRVPANACNALQKRVRKHLYDRPKRRCVVRDPNEDSFRLILLHERYKMGGELPEEVQKIKEDLGIECEPYEDVVGYSHFSAEQVLRKLFPGMEELPASFETVGHIAHLNLKDSFLQHKEIIGQVFLDKNQPHIRTVVNKLGNIEDEYRVFPMEVLAGEKNTVTEVRQHGSRFKLDYAKVYWNSRLETEHERLTKLFKEGEVVCDMMAGIGPFAVPAARKGCTVYANDLNPVSAHYLAINGKINKVNQRIVPFNMDARAFLRLLACPTPSRLQEAKGLVSCHEDAEILQESMDSIPQSGLRFDHVVMNLPASAVEFLDAFHEVIDRIERLSEGKDMPQIHCYMFAKTHETDADIVKRAELFLGAPIEHRNLHLVRNVAPNKNMYCLSFSLPAADAFHLDLTKRQKCQ